MNILITGIRGFVGLSLIKALKKEYTIYGLDIVTSEMEDVEKVYTFDELADIPNVEVVIHLAGKAIEANGFSEALEYFEANVILTRKIFNWFSKSSAGTFIFLSSIKAAADQLKECSLTENIEPKPFGVFGESKLLAEKYILSQYVIDKNVYILRPCIIIGEGHIGNKNIKRMFNWVLRGYPFPFGRFECRRSFTSIDNLIFVLKQLFIQKCPSGIYNIADDESFSVNEIFEIMGSVLGKRVRIWRLNKSIIKFVSIIGTRFNCIFDDYRYKKLSSNFVVSNEKIKKELGIKRMPVSSLNGLTKAIQGYRINYKKL
jgi:nucleoside-diphosphate-sugar epimerase